jgi:S1-C subfamily serine protease
MKTRITFLALALAVTPLCVAEPPDPVLADPVVTAVQKVLPAVVNISTEQLVTRQFRDPFEDFWRQFFGQPRRPESNGGQSLGSGVIVDEDGWLVTNWHVVRRATKIHVVLADNTKYEARYVSSQGANDLALLKIDAKKPLPYVEIATDREPLLGETVIAVGNPFGLEQTVTKGIISAKNRKYDAGDISFEDILQTDAAINPGNSGGPLINTRGQLVGINMAILSQAQGIGFAIPAKRVAGMVASWLSLEKRAQVWLGLSFAREEGRLVIANVQPDSPAAKAGLRPKDTLVTVDGERFAEVLLLQRHLLRKKAGDVVRFDLGGRRVVEVKLAALPKLSTAELMQKRFGLQVQEMTPDLARALGLPVVQGLLIADVEKDSPAATAGLQRGIVITHFAGEEIQTGDRLGEQLTDLKSGDKVSLAIFVVQRRGNLTLQQTGAVTLPAR